MSYKIIIIVIWLGFQAQAVPASDKRWSTMASQWCRLTIISNQGSYSTDTEEISELSVPLIGKAAVLQMITPGLELQIENYVHVAKCQR